MWYLCVSNRVCFCLVVWSFMTLRSCVCAAGRQEVRQDVSVTIVPTSIHLVVLTFVYGVMRDDTGGREVSSGIMFFFLLVRGRFSFGLGLRLLFPHPFLHEVSFVLVGPIIFVQTLMFIYPLS